ncbi:NAD(P)-binding Rossmann-fold superfamily protein [Striga hermonthica]|uniref:NAD(P)-binding Rossmann-fold superfamily protein n=1 Tax=Striga hermonthica TaxID=68872 RepID=A0A9N7N7V5_STRHE|nr:NAD(P)-binding Rossmann-fold superfamily protein [Striga hermonthica]
MVAIFSDTGATSGIGAETARVLAKKGVRVIIPARDLVKAEKVKDNIQRESPQAEIIILEIDLSSFDSIQRFCYEFLSLGLPLHILINNAGKYSQKLELSEDKIELTFATNYLGHFLLTEMLLGKMVETASETQIQGRIARKSNVTVNAVHPGIVKTGITRDYKGFITDSFYFVASKLLKSTSQGAATTCYVALSPNVEGIGGKYFADCNETQCSPLANDDIEARNLWKQTRAFIKRRFYLPVTPDLDG